ncbi:MAG: hypothetical protein V2I51_15595, partial [Anderseniella sp.]|nr:hypothetical protein [Anderseniella sp.]
MSGIAGIIHFDGKPVEPGLIEKMTGAMAHRGPDDINHWVKGSVALGHCALRVTESAGDPQQPFTIDGNVWIAADARIDARADLIRTLRSRDCAVTTDAADVELIAHAYNLFGRAFLRHIIGDFAIALWDHRKARLFCARDHFGVRPFFYVQHNGVFLFASCIDALLTHPIVPRSLDEEFIGDFLLFGNCQDAERSVYRHIRRLPPATCFELSEGACRIRRYWSLREKREIRFARDLDYIEQFQQL